MTTLVFPLIPTVQQYDWGKIGLQSKVAQFASASKAAGFRLDENAPYAELWMGTHTKSPSRIRENGEVLSKYLAANPSLIGDEVLKNFGAEDGNIPFLFKVLAIEKALSIQTHPDKKMAERLHAEQPDIYKDPNHKPEMALALTPFTALCGFQPLPRIAAYLRSTPEFSALIPNTVIRSFLDIASSSNPSGPVEKAALRDVFSALMTADDSSIKTQLTSLIARYKNNDVKKEEEEVRELIVTLESQFPGDIGVFCAFMLNFMKLKPGEALFLGAGEPHAYVSGDIIECMATSDNVVRAGLTPKLRDIPTLISGLTYIASEPSKHLVKPQQFGSSPTTTTALYKPPVPEFAVVHVMLSKGDKDEHVAIQGPSIFIVTDGNGEVSWTHSGKPCSQELALGDVVFIASGTPVLFTTATWLQFSRAFVE